ncbi:MAG: LysM peptidoglycan-binding domain-containing protein [Microscillaceae bacterium]|jgi:LysM repeat protein|nr:LysM peptidoglycan-binding domain-containing protein [Microscillaceae bacterium]
MQHLKILLLVGLGFLFFYTEGFAQQQKIETRNGKKYIIHKVQARETVSAIARSYKVTNQEIIDLNPEVAKVVKVGALISIPVKETASEVATQPKEIKEVSIKKDYPTYKEAAVTDQEEVKHTVKKGEWLGKIAKQYNVDVAELRKWNTIEADKITPGQELIVGIRTGKSEKKNNETKTNTAVNNPNNTHNKELNKNIDKNPPRNVYREGNPSENTTVNEIDHIVKERETLSAIARQYQVKVSDIRAWNNLNSDVVKVDSKLKIRVSPNYMPNPIQPDNQVNTNTNPNPNPNSNEAMRGNTGDDENTPQSSIITYTVREGDNIWKLRERFNISSTEILFWNGRDPNNDRLAIGENLKLYIPRKVNHLIQPGETPESVATMHNVNVRQLEIWNKIPEKQINLPQNFAPGKTLAVFEPTGPTPTKEFKDKRHSNSNNQPNNNQPNTNLQANNTNQPTGNLVMHTVAQGEALYDISQKYGVSVADLKEWNGIPNNYYYVQAGNQLRVYVPNNQPINNNNTWNNNNSNNNNWNNNNTNTRVNQPSNNTNTRVNQPSNNTNNTNNNPRTNPSNNPYDNPFGNGLYEYKTTTSSTDPFEQLNNSQKQPINSNNANNTNNTNNNQTTRGNNNPDNNNYRSINPDDNPPQVSDYGNTNTSRFLNDNNTNNTNTNTRPSNNNGGNAVTETGNAALLTDIPSPRPFVALHRTAPVGTLILVTNAANRKTLVVEVVAPINSAQVGNNVVLQVTQAVMNRLGADSNNTIPVEISYMPKY